MRTSLKIGLSFGLTSGVMTTLGLMAGLHAGTHSRPAVLGGILTIAVADALSVGHPRRGRIQEPFLPWRPSGSSS